MRPLTSAPQSPPPHTHTLPATTAVTGLSDTDTHTHTHTASTAGPRRSAVSEAALLEPQFGLLDVLAAELDVLGGLVHLGGDVPAAEPLQMALQLCVQSPDVAAHVADHRQPSGAVLLQLQVDGQLVVHRAAHRVPQIDISCRQRSQQVRLTSPAGQEGGRGSLGRRQTGHSNWSDKHAYNESAP